MPVMPSYAKMLTPDDLPTLGSDSVLSNSNDDKTEKFIAEYSQSAARFISDKKKAADLADMDKTSLAVRSQTRQLMKLTIGYPKPVMPNSVLM